MAFCYTLTALKRISFNKTKASLYIFIQLKLKLKIGPSEYKRPLGFISSDANDSKWPEIAADFVETLNSKQNSQTNIFKAPYFDLISIS
jgi:hypothetical protein